jgi:hypothetical protein
MVRQKNRRLKGRIVGCEECYGQKWIKIQIQSSESGAGKRMLSESDSKLIELSDLSHDSLPAKQKGRIIANNHDFLFSIIRDKDPTDYALTSRLDTLIVGKIKYLRDDLKNTKFGYLKDGSNTLCSGTLNDLVRVKKFLGQNDCYRSRIFLIDKPDPEIEDAEQSPSFVVFDGASGFIKWHDKWKSSNQIVVLDRTSNYFAEASEIYNNLFTIAREENFPLAPEITIPPGVEYSSFWRKTLV